MFGSKKHDIIQSQQDTGHGIWHTTFSPAVLQLADTMEALLTLLVFNISCLPSCCDYGIIISVIVSDDEHANVELNQLQYIPL